MSNGYFLTDGDSSSGYFGEGRWAAINQRIDCFLRSILGNFHWDGPRNWVGWAYDGAWTKQAKFDRLHVLLGAIFGLGGFVWMIFNLPEAYFKLSIGYSILLLWAVVPIWTNYTNSKSLGEYVGFEPTNIPKYIKLSLLATFVWIVIYLILSQIQPQQIVVENMAIGIIINILLIPWAESMFFSGVTTPTFSQIGILPGVLLAAIFRTAFHWLTLSSYANFEIHLLMTFVFGIFFGILSLKYMDYGTELIGHPIANSIAFLVKIVRI